MQATYMQILQARARGSPVIRMYVTPIWMHDVHAHIRCAHAECREHLIITEFKQRSPASDANLDLTQYL